MVFDMKYTLFLILTVFMFSCTVDDNVIPAKQTDAKYIISESSGQGLSIYNATTSQYIPISTSEYSNLPTEDSVVVIQSFLKKSYIIYRSGNCFVLDNKTKEIEAHIVIPVEFGKYSSMVFPNASTAYISSGLSGKIAVIDIANNEYVKTIDDSKSAAGMEYYANEVFICNPIENRVDVYDTRTDQLLRSKNTDKAPLLIKYYAEEDLMVIATAGSGKIDDQDKSMAKLNIYKRENMELVESVPLERGKLLSVDQIPISMGLTKYSFMLINTQEGVFRYNVKYTNAMSLVNTVKYKRMIENTFSGKFILHINSETANQTHVLDDRSLKVITVMDFDRNIEYIYPLID